jgi:hypothetical protein
MLGGVSIHSELQPPGLLYVAVGAGQDLAVKGPASGGGPDVAVGGAVARRNESAATFAAGLGINVQLLRIGYLFSAATTTPRIKVMIESNTICFGSCGTHNARGDISSHKNYEEAGVQISMPRATKLFSVLELNDLAAIALRWPVPG